MNTKTYRVQVLDEEPVAAACHASQPPARRKRIKRKAQLGMNGDADVLERFMNYADECGMTYVEAIEKLMDAAGVPE